MSAIPTIRIKSDIPGCEGGLDINAADFDPKVHVEFTEEKAPDDLTREGIAKMPKSDVLELLAAHGIEGDSKAPVTELRTQLIALMFVDG